MQFTRTFLMAACVVAECVHEARLTASDLTVRWTGPSDVVGTVHGSLHSDGSEFPDGVRPLRALHGPWSPDGVTLVFTNLPAGRYSVASFLDRNGNGRLDKGVFGIPKEEWGVSGNRRPSLRAPRFEESALELPPGTNLVIEIHLAR
jgi:uncharacterized protein (DUF2141 family)